MGVLSGREILNYTERADNPLVIMPPSYKEEDLMHSNSIDLRLGLEFIMMKRAELATLDFQKDEKQLKLDIERFYERVYMGVEEAFVLHPNELVLGATLEYIIIPNDLTAYLIGRSSWGRLGLIIATATVIHPGFKGCPTLELVNHGNIPIHLFPGSPVGIAQLVLHKTKPGKPYSGKYSGWVGPTAPGYSKIHEDPYLIKWLNRNKPQS